MAKKRGLGKGLDALLSEPQSVTDVTEVSATERARDLQHVPIDRIRRGRYQPRRHFDPDALQELADSIAVQGLVQPIVVRAADDGYELIAGERRWRAAQIAGLSELPAVVRALDEQAAAAVGLIENIQRQDLNPLEEARAIARLVEDFGLSHQQVAATVGRSRASVSNLLRLQELDDTAKELVERGQLEMGHARALLALPIDRQRAIARRVVDRQLTVRATEELVRRETGGDAATAGQTSQPSKDADTRRMERELSDKLGAAVTIQSGQNGRGRLQIAYNSLDELEGILAHIR
jgi:ParB family chromosome partitioning protein